MSVRTGLVAFGCVLVLGCSLPRGAIASHGSLDGGGIADDAFVPGEDAFVPGLDAFVPPDDAFVPGIDAFVPGVDAFVPPNDAFVPPVDAFVPPDTSCAPGSACTPDGTSVVVCAAGVMSTTHCDRGCAAGACRAPVDCALTVESSVITASGRTTWDVCGHGNDNNDNHTSASCPNFGPDGEDVMLRLDLDRESLVTITASDHADRTPVDPVVYVRSVCGTRGSELACDDDGAARGFDAQISGLRLTAGEYFLIVDTFDGTATGTTVDTACGAIDLDVTLTPI